MLQCRSAKSVFFGASPNIDVSKTWIKKPFGTECVFWNFGVPGSLAVWEAPSRFFKNDGYPLRYLFYIWITRYLLAHGCETLIPSLYIVAQYGCSLFIGLLIVLCSFFYSRRKHVHDFGFWFCWRIWWVQTFELYLVLIISSCISFVLFSQSLLSRF